jgi:hypothetical protein
LTTRRKERIMTLNALLRATALAAILAAGATTGAAAQTTTADPHHPGVTPAQATPAAPGGMAGQGQGMQPGMMPPGMMGRGMMGSEMPMMGMHGHMMKIMFAIADTDSDGALSFEEVTAIHKRIFDSVDANKNGKVTAEELQAFMRE